MKMKDRSYADLLKGVNNRVNSSELGLDIGDIRKPTDGSLLIMIQNGSNKAEIFKREVTEKLLSN